MRSLLLTFSFVAAMFAQILVFDSRSVFAWFATGQDANILLSGIDFNNTGGALLFNHPTVAIIRPFTGVGKIGKPAKSILKDADSGVLLI
jgi:hypothetical protein